MTSRRAFIRTLAALPPALALPSSWAAAPDASRLALVIGNSAYAENPLENPANDAKAVSAMFSSAGFSVDTRLNANRQSMVSAIEAFGTAIQRSDAKLVVFYYAGHGVQLDWRNYLLPVNAEVTQQEHIKERCVDLGLLLGQLRVAKNRSFVIILDACRNNPFGSVFRPEQKGLSQFDAPVGSLLAYATSPGNVASDGSGENGLYTEHLVRELSKRGTRLEDALKRVRLNVRLASQGEQIPWETTSLEEDVFIFNDAKKPLSESEIEQQLEAETIEWQRIKQSRKMEDWVGYLTHFPSGRFSEIAQMRLNRLLAEFKPQALASEKPVPSLVTTSPAPTGLAAATPVTKPLIDIRPGNPIPRWFQTSANPYSAGRYPLGRQFSLGDEFGLLLTDMLTGIGKEQSVIVTAIDLDSDIIQGNNGTYIWDAMGNVLKDPDFNRSETPRQFHPAELQVGKKWAASWRVNHPSQGWVTASYALHISSFDRVRVPAGEFDAFVITIDGWDTRGRRHEGKLWIVPGLNIHVKRELWIRGRQRGVQSCTRFELTYLKQHTVSASLTSTLAGSVS